MIKVKRLNESSESRHASSLLKGDIFEDNGRFYRVDKIRKVGGPDCHIEIQCTDRNDNMLTINYDYNDYDKVRIYYDRDFTWTFSFLIVDKLDNCIKKQMIINTFSKSEAISIFETRCKKEYSKYLIREVRIEMNQVHY